MCDSLLAIPWTGNMVCELKHFNNLGYTSYGFYTTSFGHHNFKPLRERGHQAITNGEELRPLQLKLQQFFEKKFFQDI